MAQSFTVRECYESEIPSVKRAEYYKEAHRIIENHYMLLLESVGDVENRDVIIEQMISDKRTVALKTEFLLTQDNNLSFCNPQQYYTRFEYIYKDLVDKVNFKVDNFKDGKIMMNSLISCFIPVEYDLALMEGDKMLFKRRCRMHCLFPRATASKLVKVMQVEPVKDIVSYKPAEKVIWSVDQLSGTPQEWYQKAVDFFEKKEYEQAVIWYTYAASKGHLAAQNVLGICYEFGYGVPQSYEKAVEWYTKAAEQGHDSAQCNLGYCYINGYGVPQSDEKAVEWYTKAANQGHARAQCSLGYCYNVGEGVPQSYEKAVEWYTKAAVQGYAIAQYNLGYCYNVGQGVPQSYEKAVEWYTKAAEQEHDSAQCNLGYCYENGYGVPQSYEKAVEWYTKAAEQGDATAQCNLGYCYRNGYGVPQSYEKAVEWYTKAANQGYAKAQFNLSKLLFKGKGVQKSYLKSVGYYFKAAYNGHEGAVAVLVVIFLVAFFAIIIFINRKDLF